MALKGQISIIGLYNWDNSLFDDFNVPEGVDKNTAVMNILYKCADLEIYIPDWDVLKTAIGIWSTKNAWKWEKLYETMNFVYNPIWNKDGTITETLQAADEGAGTNTGSVTSENQVSGYNVNSYSPESKNVTSPDTAWTENRSRGETRTRQEQGNIGLTSTQELIRQEREVSDFSIYDVITEDFKKEFCLLVY
jgi:hypothetical protein